MAKSETITRLHVENFTAFSDVTMDFVPGINVLIGENSTGKSHVMKLTYGVLSAIRMAPRDSHLVPAALAGVFRPDNSDAGRLVRKGQTRASFELTWASGASLRWSMTDSPSIAVGRSSNPPPSIAFATPVFIPSREVLSMYEGFVAAYEKRELSFDETYYDLCKALGATSLKGKAAEEARELLEPLEQAMGGKVVLKGQRFYLKPSENGDGMLEAHLLAEGYRKLASLVHLIANGTIDANTVLLWDEPEANLNPKLTSVLIKVLLGLAAKGVQIILATHDFLLAHEFSMLADYKQTEGVPVRFSLMSRKEPNAPVTVQQADSLADLSDNPILAAYAAHYDRERHLFASAE